MTGSERGKSAARTTTGRISVCDGFAAERSWGLLVLHGPTRRYPEYCSGGAIFRDVASLEIPKGGRYPHRATGMCTVALNPAVAPPCNGLYMRRMHGGLRSLSTFPWTPKREAPRPPSCVPRPTDSGGSRRQTPCPDRAEHRSNIRCEIPGNGRPFAQSYPLDTSHSE